jgi:hypothetical protein
LAVKKEIVTPECVLQNTDKSYDLNTFKLTDEDKNEDWTPYITDGVKLPSKGEGRLYLENLRVFDLVEVDSVGTTINGDDSILKGGWLSLRRLYL